MSLLAALLPLAASAPSQGRAHAHAHRTFHNAAPRGQSHSHGHAHRDAHAALAAVAVKPRAPPPCGGKARPEGSDNVGGVFADAAATYTTAASETSTLASVASTTPSERASLGAGGPAMAQLAVVFAGASNLGASQQPYTLVTSYAYAPTVASARVVATATVAGNGSGSAAGAGLGAETGPLPTGDPDNLTILVLNKMKYHMTTSHMMNDDLPAHVLAIAATLTDGTMAAGATTTMVYPSGWAGNMGVAKAATSDEEDVDLVNASLLEGSFVGQMGSSGAVGDIDISYV